MTDLIKVEKLVDSCHVSIISSVDENGYPLRFRAKHGRFYQNFKSEDFEVK